eukprot:gene26133-34173_t
MNIFGGVMRFCKNMKLRCIRYVLVIVGAVLVAAIVAVCASGSKMEPAFSADIRLADALPRKVANMTVRDEPIASTTEMAKAVIELLNYDDAICRVYVLNDLRISVYIATWSPGKMSSRLVSGHTPDICWPAAGWTRVDFGGAEMGSVVFRDLGFPAGNFRVFSQGASKEYMVFWHRVGKKYLSYKNGGSPPWWAFASEVWMNGISFPQKGQLFFRVSANMPLDSFWGGPQFESIRLALIRLGLVPDKWFGAIECLLIFDFAPCFYRKGGQVFAMFGDSQSWDVNNYWSGRVSGDNLFDYYRSRGVRDTATVAM